MRPAHAETLNRSKSDGGVSGRQRLLDAAVRWLDTSCGADLRMSAIAEEAGVTIALITYHFGSRDGLIAAAQRIRVAGAAREDIDFMNAALTDTVSVDTWREHLQQLLAVVLDDQRAARRLSRVAALAAAHGRDTLKDELSEEMTQVFSALADQLERAQSRGLLRDDVNPRATAAAIQSLLFGFVLTDLDDKRAAWDDIRSVVMLMFDSLAVTTRPE
ncbi:MAG: TetR/AcrR family transcriptional regulator [Nitriliruptoraceae bacterium]